MAADRRNVFPSQVDLDALRCAGRAEFGLAPEIEAQRLTAAALRTVERVDDASVERAD
jgi:hypothetical protein